MLPQITQIIAPLNMEERFQKVEELTELFTNGNYNPLDLHLIFKGWMDTIEATLKNTTVKNAIDSELDKMPKSFEHLKCKVAQVSKKTYDFKVCNDSEYDDLVAKMESVKVKIKERETFLKSLPVSGTVDPTTGELINRPTYTESEYIRITF